MFSVEPGAFVSAQAIIPCADLQSALKFFLDDLGFRIEAIIPADAPSVAIISGHGVTLRLEQNGQEAHVWDTEDVLITRDGGDDWHLGRAAMQYRNLIPGRLGGRFVASHIRVPAGGLVPDFVHYHCVQFQMIFCTLGWARLVYEDQGAPFVMNAGDCVLQPPQIRHRVIETSPGFEVIEIARPAIHETIADNDLLLPNNQLNPTREFTGQRFVRHVAAESVWKPWASGGFEVRDSGIAAATCGLADVYVLRSDGRRVTTAIHGGEFFFGFILRGEVKLRSAAEHYRLTKGDCFTLPAPRTFEIEAYAGTEILLVTLPATKT